jgi:hypothetical protein
MHSLIRSALLIPMVLGFLLAVPGSPARAEGDLRTERVHFAKGASNAVVKGTITGYQTVDYVLGAAKGQSMNVSMATDNTASYFNILAPGETEVAFFNGSMGENQYEGVLPATGDYKIRVYMMRSAARRNEKANYRLEMNVTDATHGASGGDALVPGTGYHATAQISCVAERGKPMSQCDAGVKRTAGGGSVHVTTPDVGAVEVYEIPDAFVFGG